MSDKTLYTIIVHSENIAGLLNCCIYPPPNKHREFERVCFFY